MVIDSACCLLPELGLTAIPIYPLPPIRSGGRIAVPRPVVNVDTTHVSDCFEALPEPVAPLIDALAGPRAGEDGLHARVDRIEVPQKLLQIEVQMLQQIHFVDQYQVGRAEHERVLQRLLLTLRDGGDHDPDLLTHPELGRTHQVAHVFDDEDIYVLEREFAQAGADHVGVQMALAAESWVGVYLHQGDVETGQPVGVQGSLYIAFEDAETELIAQPLQRALQQRSLSSTWRAHHVDRIRFGPVEHVPVGPGERVVGIQDVLKDHFLDRRSVHPYASSNSSVSTISSSPSRISRSKLPHPPHCRGKSTSRLSTPHKRHFPTAGICSISSSAPSTGVPSARSPKPKDRAEGTTWRR